jgi:hypothetical protein
MPATNIAVLSRVNHKKGWNMAHKFAVGQAVEYKPIGAKVGVFKIVKQMPDEFRAAD